MDISKTEEKIEVDLNVLSPELKVRDVTGEAGTHAGLVGVDSTFTFSPRDFKDGKNYVL